MAKKVNMKPHYSKKGKALLNPAQKARKYSVELKHGVGLTNELRRKRTKTGSIQKINKTQRAYRAGYLDARKDNAGMFKFKKKMARRNSRKRK